MIKKLPNGSLPPFCYIRRKLKRKLNEPWIKAIPTKFLVFNATHPQYAPTALVAIMPPSPEYTCTNPNSTDEMSNAALQPFHLKKENKISPLNKISCPNPLNAKLYKLRSAATRRVMSVKAPAHQIQICSKMRSRQLSQSTRSWGRTPCVLIQFPPAIFYDI